MTIHYIADNSSILDSPAQILVVPVNCQPGVMGAGLAKAFAERWPGLKDAHRKSVQFGMLSPGGGHSIWIIGDPSLTDPFGIYMLPTKDHWRDPSRLEWVEKGLTQLGREIARCSHPQWGDNRIKSCAVPAIGTGLGGLKWSDVHPLIVRLVESLPEIDWFVYPPKDSHGYAS